MAEPQRALLPKHVGVIMDGNRRWAAQHGVPTFRGHRAGFDALFALIPVIKQLGIPYVTIYTFSTENWLRSQTEVKALMKLVLWVVKNRLKTLKEQGIRVCIIGSKQGIPADILAALQRAETETASGNALTLGVCFNYGGQQEIVDATKAMIRTGVPVDDVTPETFAQYLYAPAIPPVDLVIRTSGEYRLSGFMLWRTQYAELYFSDVLWPDFNEAELNTALEWYAERKRRFGK